MRTLYLECNMGAAGDMLMSALYGLLDKERKEEFLSRMRTLEMFGVKLAAERAESCGIAGTHISVKVYGTEEDECAPEHCSKHIHEYHHEHKHSRTALEEIEHILSHLELSDKVKDNAVAVYRLIGDAESRAHGCSVSQIHFHEVGSLDAVADVTGVCLLMEMIDAERIYASAVRTVFGQIKCAHGILPIPAPATAILLEGIPCFAGDIEGEFCTPTGAALLKYFAANFQTRPAMVISRTGYGMGSRKYNAANCIRAFLGETEDQEGDVAELCCNIDDMTPEALAFAAEELMSSGALDVYTTPIIMKKGRAAFMLTCMCSEEKRGEMLAIIFRHTTTLGVREYSCRRYRMSRSEYVKETVLGNVRIKKSEGYGVVREKAEYADLAEIARSKGLSLAEVQQMTK